jgi:hypothetical protein
MNHHHHRPAPAEKPSAWDHLPVTQKDLSSLRLCEEFLRSLADHYQSRAVRHGIETGPLTVLSSAEPMAPLVIEKTATQRRRK